MSSHYYLANEGKTMCFPPPGHATHVPDVILDVFLVDAPRGATIGKIEAILRLLEVAFDGRDGSAFEDLLEQIASPALGSGL